MAFRRAQEKARALGIHPLSGSGITTAFLLQRIAEEERRQGEGKQERGRQEQGRQEQGRQEAPEERSVWIVEDVEIPWTEPWGYSTGIFVYGNKSSAVDRVRELINGIFEDLEERHDPETAAEKIAKIRQETDKMFEKLSDPESQTKKFEFVVYDEGYEEGVNTIIVRKEPIQL